MRRLLFAATVLLPLAVHAPIAGACGPTAFAEAAAYELQGLRSGVTPAAWRAGHARDQIEHFELPDHGGAGAGDWCARAWQQVQLNEDAALREAYFYVPERPSSGALPNDAEGARLVMTRCQHWRLIAGLPPLGVFACGC